MNYYNKYLKYKNKYLKLLGGSAVEKNEFETLMLDNNTILYNAIFINSDIKTSNLDYKYIYSNDLTQTIYGVLYNIITILDKEIIIEDKNYIPVLNI